MDPRILALAKQHGVSPQVILAQMQRQQPQDAYQNLQQQTQRQTQDNTSFLKDFSKGLKGLLSGAKAVGGIAKKLYHAVESPTYYSMQNLSRF